MHLKKESYKDDNHGHVGVIAYMNKNFHLYKYLGVLLLVRWQQDG